MKWGAKTGCHQAYTRSFHVGDYQFPLCARCTGLAVGQLAAVVFTRAYAHAPPGMLLAAALISISLLGVDGLGQYHGYWESTNLRRVLTGLSCGFFVVGAVVRAVLLLIRV